MVNISRNVTLKPSSTLLHTPYRIDISASTFFLCSTTRFACVSTVSPNFSTSRGTTRAVQISGRKSAAIELERDNIFSTGRCNDELTRIRFNYVAESGARLNRYSIDW